MLSGQWTAGHRHHLHRHPGLSVGYEIPRPMRAGGKRSFTHRFSRRRAQPRAMDVGWQIVSAAARQEEERVEPFRRFVCGDDRIDHLAGSQRPMNETNEIAAPFLYRIVK